MARRHSQPFFEVSVSVDDFCVEVTHEFGGFVAKLNLKAIKDALRQRTNRFLRLVAKATKKISPIFSNLLKGLKRILARSLRKSFETVISFIFVTAFVFCGYSILKWFSSTSLASTYGVNLTTDQILLIVDKIIDLVF